MCHVTLANHWALLRIHSSATRAPKRLMHSCKPRQPCKAGIMHAQRTSILRADRCTVATQSLRCLRPCNRSISIKAATSMQSSATQLTSPSSTVTLNDQNKLPVLGLGVFKAEAGDACKNAVVSALKQGYRHIDTAQIYQNEEAVGQGLKESGVPRDSVFVTSKVPPPAWSNAAEAFQKTLDAVQLSLQRMGLGYLDLMLLHAAGGAEGRPEAWRALETAQEKGWVRSIGISNMGVPEMTQLAATAKVIPAVSQIELHPWLQNKHVTDYCKEHNIVLEAYCPLAQGTKLSDPQLVKMAERVGKTPAQVLLRWSLQKGFVPLPKSVSPERQAENAALFGWELSDADMATLDSWETGISIMGAKLG